VSAAGDVMGTREVAGDDADCRALDARLAFIVAVSIDPKASGPVVAEPAPVAAQPPPVAQPRPRASAPGSVWVELESENKEVVLYRHVGTAYGSVGGQSAVITTISKECVAPCEQYIEQPKSDFFISGAGITLSDTFSLLSYPQGVKLKVKAGSSVMRYLGWMLSVLSVSALAVGIPLAIVSANKVDPHPGVQNPYGGGQNVMRDASLGLIIGGAAALAGGIPLIAFSGTKVEFFPLPADSAPSHVNTSEI
jgi:hypothetical protein